MECLQISLPGGDINRRSLYSWNPTAYLVYEMGRFFRQVVNSSYDETKGAERILINRVVCIFEKRYI